VADEDAVPDSEKYINSSVYARDLEWLPLEGQAERFGEQGPCTVHPNILVAKLRPGQEIDLVLKAVKDVGSVHAKWSPVGTASYRLMPAVRLLKPVEGDMVDRLIELMPRVFRVEQAADAKGGRRAVVENPRECTMDRNISQPSIAGEQLSSSVEVGRVKGHYIFSVESTGALNCVALVQEALAVLVAKCRDSQGLIDKLD
jgi:DNA-directed RNA polymerase I and III subunit RPAC1